VARVPALRLTLAEAPPTPRHCRAIIATEAAERGDVIRHVIWDVDGTLFDTYPAIVGSLHAAATDLGAPVALDETHALALIEVDHCLKVLAATYDLPLDLLADGFARHYQQTPPADQPPFDGAAEACRLIQARGGLNLIVTHRRRAGLDRLLAANGMADLFADIISHDDGFPRKPDPSAFLTLIERHHLPREETLAIGDRELDILAAQAAGLSAALVGTAAVTATPEVVLPDFHTLRRMIDTGWAP
jgi:phosphoglycolate phosphatase-like HAD superfamily hydrolase